ncbi:MAG: hypothetical protein LBS34_03325 [Rickettsiales bacterium]|jgi:hypothetical protein|nr:hypothetical protein [Rickettsiales bacterium]
MRKKSILLAVIIEMLGCVLWHGARAEEPFAVIGDWTLFKIVDEKKGLLCYMVSLPQKRYDNFNKRGQSFFSVITEGGGGKTSEIYLSFGHIMNKKIVSAELDIVKRKFPIFVYDDKAWAYNTVDDDNIVKNLKKSAVFSVNVEYENGKRLIDLYSLNGFEEAHEELLKTCK